MPDESPEELVGSPPILIISLFNPYELPMFVSAEKIDPDCRSLIVISPA